MRRGLVRDLEAARADIDAGRVTVAGAPATNQRRLVSAADPILLRNEVARFVSRGGEKLDAALEHFGVDVTGKRVLDAGASTGGFTDCVLQRGAREVVAVDVGYGLLHERLGRDARVRSLERKDVRDLDRDVLGQFDLVVADLSFISLDRVLDGLVELCGPDCILVLLVKPQFEAARVEADKGRGVITDPHIWRRVLEEVITAVRRRGAVIMGVMASPITGAEGNVEFLLTCRGRSKSPQGSVAAPVDLDAVLAEVIARQDR